MNESNVVFRSADDEYRSLRSQYGHELRQLRRTGAMDAKTYADWSLDGKLDAERYPKVKELWERMEATYPGTRWGLAESKAAAADNAHFPVVTETPETDSPLDQLLIDALPRWKGKTAPVAQLAAMFVDTDVTTFLASFRRIRTKLQGVKAYECSHNGTLAIEIIEASNV